MPILQFDTLDVVPEGLREYAKPIEGTDRFQVNVVSATKIDEFRDNNIKLSKERDDYRAQVEPLKTIIGDDPEAYKARITELEATFQRVKDGDLKESRSIEEALAKRTEELRKSYEDRLQAEGKEKAAWRQRHDALEQNYKYSQVSSYLKDAVLAPDSGVKAAAAGDLVDVGLKIFKMEANGRITPYEGDAPIYGTDGTTPMTAKEWVASMKEKRDYYFEGTGGGGAGDGGKGGDGQKRILGRTHADLKKMTAAERLAVANGDTSIPRR